VKSSKGVWSLLLGIVLMLVAVAGKGGAAVSGVTMSGVTMFWESAAIAAPLSTNHPVLSLELLTQRIAEPVRQGGGQMVDLRGFTINLRAESAESEAFAGQFYQRLQTGLNNVRKGNQPLGLDVSGSVIQGDFELARLGLRVPAYGGVALPALDAFTQAVPSSGSSGSSRSPTGALAQSLLIQPQPVQLDTVVFQGPLLMNQACFTGAFKADGLYLLNRVEAEGAVFTQKFDWRGAQLARSVNFNQAQFQQESNFRTALFASRARFAQASFGGFTQWQGARFQGNASFAQAEFQGGNFSRSRWQTNADFDQATFHNPISFQKARFDQALFLTEAQFESAVNFRQAQFQDSVSLRGARIFSQMDFGDARFASASSINVADLDFNAGEAKILGSPGQIGRVFSVPSLAKNETVLRNLVRNFRLLEQIGDANQVEYTTERLRLAQIKRQILGVSINQASLPQLMRLGLSATQANALAARIQTQPLVSRSDLLSVNEVDLASYLKVRDRITVKNTTVLSRLQWLVYWLLLAGLLLSSSYGTNAGLAFSVGLVATTLFGLIFWLIDRYRQQLALPSVLAVSSAVPVPTVSSAPSAPAAPSREEALYTLLGGGASLAVSISVLSGCSDYPLRTLVALSTVLLPVPLAIMLKLYQQGRSHHLSGHVSHHLMESSYFVKNGALRKLQVLIARLPVIPQYPFYRDRYLPLLVDRRWNWLNYYDFSLNNWFKFGFNDIRLRDRAVPGLISSLVWYQWGLGTVYIALLLWTLSRTIPGLNLLLYF
jgi:uncharacterized protein YjbI with pentapeptide repeats